MILMGNFILVTLLIMNSKIHPSFALASPTSPAGKSKMGANDIIDLQNQHRSLSPYEAMSSIAASCEILGIEKFDVYGDFSEDKSTSYMREFEAEVAEKFQMEDAVFMPSGTMAQNIALLIHSKKGHMSRDELSRFEKNPMRFACHHSSHLLLWEEQSYSKLAGIEAVEISTKSKKFLDVGDDIASGNRDFRIPPIRFVDVEDCFNSQKETLSSGTQSLGDDGLSTMILELPHRELGGKLTPWEEVISIGELCKKEGVFFHCDGARIFEASAGYKKSLEELAEPFDSMYISFYKGLGGISGAMLMGTKPFCDEARVWLRRFGGNLYTLMPYAISCWAVFRHYGMGIRMESLSDLQSQSRSQSQSPSPMTFAERFDKLKGVTHRITSETKFDEVAAFDPREPETNMIHVYLKGTVAQCEAARDLVMKQYGIKVFNRLREIPPSGSSASHDGEGDEDNDEYSAYFEWTMGEANGRIEDDDFVLAWNHFVSNLIDMRK